MLSDNLAAWIFGPPGKRIFFSSWPEVENAVRRNLRFTRHTVHFGTVASGYQDYDLVVPMTVEALLHCTEDEVLRRRNPLPIPSREAILLCDHKAELNQFLCRHGFDEYIPKPTQDGVYPYILKRKQDSNSQHCFKISLPEDEMIHAERLSSPDYFAQQWIEGRDEYAVHILMIKGRMKKALTVSYEMENAFSIRGRNHLVNKTRIGNRHLDIFERMLQRIGFEGLCCINYKEHRGRPMLLEINPRFGFSLGNYFLTFLNELDWSDKRR